jgi:hypothetical protein
MELSLRDQLLITVTDKALIGGLLAFGAYLFSRSLEKFKATQALELEAFRASQALEMSRFAQEQSRKLEELKNRLLAETESRRNIRLALAEVSRRVATASHCICWTAWPAKYSPKDFTSAYLEKYDAEIHLLLSDIVAARVALAALSPSVHSQIGQFIDRLYDLDVRMGQAKAVFAEDRDRGILEIAKLHTASGRLDDDLLEAVTKVAFDGQAPCGNPDF